MSERLEHHGRPCRQPIDTDETSCDFCGDTYYEYDMIMCEQCGRETCDECSVECAGCGRSRCRACMENIADDYYCGEDCYEGR